MPSIQGEVYETLGGGMMGFNLDKFKAQYAYDSATGLFERILGVRGHAKTKKVGTVNWDGYIRILFNGKPYPAHKLAWAMVYGYYPEIIIDHINGDKKDNRIDNLRESSPRLNQHNRKEHRAGKLVGAIQDKRSGKWVARITVDKKKVYLGTYLTMEEANAAYLKAFESILQLEVSNGL